VLIFDGAGVLLNLAGEPVPTQFKRSFSERAQSCVVRYVHELKEVYELLEHSTLSSAKEVAPTAELDAVVEYVADETVV
jgi:hypothetical protein